MSQLRHDQVHNALLVGVCELSEGFLGGRSDRVGVVPPGADEQNFQGVSELERLIYLSGLSEGDEVGQGFNDGVPDLGLYIFLSMFLTYIIVIDAISNGCDKYLLNILCHLRVHLQAEQRQILYPLVRGVQQLYQRRQHNKELNF